MFVFPWSYKCLIIQPDGFQRSLRDPNFGLANEIKMRKWKTWLFISSFVIHLFWEILIIASPVATSKLMDEADIASWLLYTWKYMSPTPPPYPKSNGEYVCTEVHGLMKQMWSLLWTLLGIDKTCNLDDSLWIRLSHALWLHSLSSFWPLLLSWTNWVPGYFYWASHTLLFGQQNRGETGTMWKKVGIP